MDTDLQHTLLQLFQQASENPGRMPEISFDTWQAGSMEWQLLISFRNVLERFQQSRQDVQKSEERFSLAVQSTNDGLWDWDIRTDVVYFSPRWKSMLGYEDHEISHHFDELLKRVHPEDRERVQETIQDYLNGRTASYKLEHRLQHKDGTYRWLLARGVLLRDKDGKPFRMAGSHTDITERKQAEEHLREKEAQYRSIFEATIDAVFITDLEDGHIIEANPAACKIYGCAYDEFIGLLPSAIIHPDRLSFFLEKTLPSVNKGGEWHTRGVNLRKDGTAFPVDVHETAFICQGEPRMLAVIRDITEQVKGEEQLRKKEEQYRSIFEATTDAMLIVDLEESRVVEVNPAACQVYGYHYEEFIGLSPTTFMHPDSRPFFPEFIHKIKDGQAIHFRDKNVRKDGSIYHIELHGIPFIYKGKLHGMAVVRDITEQVQAYELLEERTRELSTLLDISHNVASNIDLKPLLAIVLDQLKKVVDYTGSSFSILEEEDLVLVENRGPAPLNQVLQ